MRVASHFPTGKWLRGNHFIFCSGSGGILPLYMVFSFYHDCSWDYILSFFRRIIPESYFSSFPVTFPYHWKGGQGGGGNIPSSFLFLINVVWWVYFHFSINQFLQNIILGCCAQNWIRYSRLYRRWAFGPLRRTNTWLEQQKSFSTFLVMLLPWNAFCIN